MELILQRRQHAKVATSATNSPKKIRVGPQAGLDLFSIHRHDMRRQQVVTRGAELSAIPTVGQRF
jgi:hypothetical protein